MIYELSGLIEINKEKLFEEEGRKLNDVLSMIDEQIQNLKDRLFNELVCLSNLENVNSIYINEELSQKDRLIKLNEIAISQMKILTSDNVKLIESKNTNGKVKNND